MIPRESFDASKKSLSKKNHPPRLSTSVKLISVFVSLCSLVIIKLPGFNQSTFLRTVVGLLSIFGLVFSFKKNSHIRGLVGLENQTDTTDEKPEHEPVKHKRNLKNKIREELKPKPKTKSESGSELKSGSESKDLLDEKGNTDHKEETNSQKLAFQQFVPDCFPALQIKPKPETRVESKLIAESSVDTQDTQAQVQPGTILFSNTMRYDPPSQLSGKAHGSNTSGFEVDPFANGEENGNGANNSNLKRNRKWNRE